MRLEQGRTRADRMFSQEYGMSISIEDALGDVKQISTSLPESFDPAHSRLLAKAACILLASNQLVPGRRR